MWVVEKWWLPLVSVVVPDVRKVVVISSGVREVGFGVSLKASVGRAGMLLMDWMGGVMDKSQNFL